MVSIFNELRLDNVGRRFGGVRALSDVSMRIHQGEFIALLGPSGCGKSTTLNCIAGLLPLTEGEIWADSTRVDTLAPEKRGFGMVFQSYALFPHMTVRDNIGFGLKMRGVHKKDIATRVERGVQMVRLEEHVNKLPGQLSGGQQQRVAIARAIVMEPALVLMDEPLSNLDAKLRLEMRTEIRRLHNELGLTTVYVTHDQEEALSMADRLVVLRKGIVEQIGRPEELHASPRTWYVADFMGYRNLLRPEVTGRQKEMAALAFGGETLLGTAVDNVMVGDEVVVGARPEDVHVLDAARAMGSDQHLSGRVEVCQYQGREYALEVRTLDGSLWHAKSMERVEAGTDIRLFVEPSRLRVFEARDSMLEEAGLEGAVR